MTLCNRISIIIPTVKKPLDLDAVADRLREEAVDDPDANPDEDEGAGINIFQSSCAVVCTTLKHYAGVHTVCRGKYFQYLLQHF